ncbi:hypothetical protein [uncultured Friedmanniella sp.]|uniref:hypothetical protein n=1 Tax=uncultured Friedmanniella sp. TaxID=335381 RepID=UPI0035CC9BF9
MLLRGDAVVGANLAFYCERTIEGRRERFCNLAALCVSEPARPHTFRLLRALLRQPGYHFTDLSPSGSVIELDRRLGFQFLDTATTLVLNIPRPRRGVQLIADVDEIERLLTGRPAQLFADHRSALGAQHLLIRRGHRHSYVLFRRDRRRGLPLFATVLYVSDQELFRDALGTVASFLLIKHGAIASLIERRVVEVRPRLSWPLSRPRPKAFKSASLGEEHVDYLYTELTCVPW